ncbi:MAG: hypothetical protein FIA99_03955 [Ruminiclostridium sp.]|nr:hypothetical protein [Ruminiclostridium sp.]
MNWHKYMWQFSPYYDPEIGRFITEDTNWGKDSHPLSLNLYTYVANNPIMFVDPSGHSWEDVWNGFKSVGSGVVDFVQGVGSGVMETITYGTSSDIEIYYYRDNETAYIIGKIVGNATAGAFGTIETIAGGTGAVVTSPTVVGAVALGAVAAHGVTVVGSSFGNAAKNVTILKANSNNGGGGSNNSSKKMTAKEAEQAAKKLGYEKTNYTSHGQPVFKKGNKYITPDVDSHNGGSWKMADSVKNLGSKSTRMGTYDAKLKRIGD